MAKTMAINPAGMRMAPGQSILTPMPFLSSMSEGMKQYEVTAVIAERMVPMKKNHLHEENCAVTPSLSD